ncbi:translation initiation factor, putative [Trypanosoma cruzi marinkellei]|uniref:Translation initiation factor, putative n=1 Tax=Trypanosoma cruzi marinkellei TaxID=85056 RepID=K2NE79_TRYCR|nr:translation initiation factor, putative [Trypanosoma cruzi marinkellei]
MEAAPEATLSTHSDPVTMGGGGGGATSSLPPPSASAATATSPALTTTTTMMMMMMGDRMDAPQFVGNVEDVFEITYDNYTANDLYILLKRITRQEVERRMIEHEQLRQKQQRVPQVERFLDATFKTGINSNSNSNSNTNNTNNNANSSGIGIGGNNNNNNNKTTEEGCGYNYSVMLRRLFFALNRNKESSAMTERNRLPEPKLEKIGKKKVIITNFGRICQAFNRPIQDVKDYIEKELSVGGNLDSNDALILKYEIQKSTAFDNILYKYLDEFVKCNSCHKIDTTLTKEGRRMELRCNWCTATRTVQAVGSATYSAQVGKRSKARLQAMTL